MSYVLGLDPSLTAAGLAWIARDSLSVGSTTLRSTGHVKDTLERRGARLTGLLDVFAAQLDLLGARGGVELAVIEGASHGSVGGAAWDRAGLWWAMVLELLGRDIPLAVCAPLTRIKWATGYGKASQSTKTDVGVALLRLWPSAECRGDNEWDALALATMAAQRLAWPVPTLARHAHAQTTIVWPPRGPLVDLEGVS